MRHLKTFEELNEGTSNYWPGYSDDGTSDTLSGIRDKTSVIMNRELRKMEKKVLGYSHVPPEDSLVWDDLPGKTKEEKREYAKQKDGFYQKWMYANLITTSLQDGFYIDVSLAEKALEHYEELLADPNMTEYTSKNKKPEYFQVSIAVVIKRLKEELAQWRDEYNREYVYAPGFMDRYDEARQVLDIKYDPMFKHKKGNEYAIT